MWEPFFFMNTLALSITLLVNICFLYYLLLHVRRKTGTLMILFSSLCSTLFVLTATIELFVPIPLVSFSVAFVAPFLLMSFLLVAQTVPNKPLASSHLMQFVCASIMAVIVATPGMVYENIIPTADGYVVLIAGPYASLFDLYLLGIIVATLVTYYRRITREENEGCRFIFKMLMTSFLIYIAGFTTALFILPAFDINFFTNFVLSLSATIVVGTFAIMYTQRFTHTHESECSLM